MNSHEPLPPIGDGRSLCEILDEIAAQAPARDPNEVLDPSTAIGGPGPGVRPHPEAFARSIAAYRQEPDWSAEKLERLLLLLRRTLARRYDVEAAVALYRSMAEPTLPKKK